MSVEILGNPCQAAFCSKDASYNLASLFLPLHAMYFPVIELPVSSGTIYLKKQQENLGIAVVTYSSVISLSDLLTVFLVTPSNCFKLFSLFLPSVFKGNQTV